MDNSHYLIMKFQSNKPVILFLIIGISIPLIIIGKIFYNQYAFSSDKGLQTQLVEKISKAENVSPDKIKIEKIDSYGKGKRTFVVVYYKVNNSEQKSKTFIYNQAILGRIVVGKEVK